VREAHSLERTVGMAYYVGDADGVGGRLRREPEDFRVREIEAVDAEPADADSGAYPHVVIRATVRDWATADFASALSDRIGISRERVSWAGTKDKRAITTQLISVEGIDPGDVPAVPNADLEVLGRAGRPVLFGDLLGNEFDIVVRECSLAEPGVRADDITDELATFGGEDRRVGVPNYFGQQRFGSRRPVTHAVGLAIVRGDWEDAVLAYVGNPHEREPEATREAREYVEETRDWRGATERFPSSLGYERAICHHLAEHGEEGQGAFRDALSALPSSLQQLFVHAAQSLLFNRFLSRRLDRGLPFDRPVAGDVVCFREETAPADLPLPDPDRTQRVTADRLATVERHCERGRAFVTAPLVGTDTTLAEGEPGEIERAVLAEARIEPADFELPEPFGSGGTRRAVLVRTEPEIEAVGEDALSLSFSLPKGSYATVLLREYLKADPDDLA
jgi:tRNA pseudouridine13 synthase